MTRARCNRPTCRNHFTTIIVCADGKEYDIGKREYPPSPPKGRDGYMIREKKHRIVAAFTRVVKRSKIDE